jgi:xanthine dehydrogenase YagS FAD-binding subunit
VSCSAAAKLDGGKLSNVRVVLGAVSNVPHQVEAANKLLEGKTVDDALANKAADVILQEAHAFSDNGYKIPMARTLIRRALMALSA